MSFAYLNNKEKLNNELDTFNKQLIKLNETLNKTHNCTCANQYSCNLHKIQIANSNKTQLGNISKILNTYTKWS